MQFRTLLSLFALLLCCTLSAQTTAERAKERAQNRAENRANSKVDQKVDKAVDDAFNAVGNLFKKKKKKNKKNNGADPEDRVDDGGLAPNNGEEYADDDEVRGALSNLFGGGDFEPYTNESSFSMNMHMSTTNKKGKTETSDMQISVVPTKVGTIMEMTNKKGKTERVQMVFNTQDGKTTLINEENGQRTGTRIRMPQMNIDVSEEIQEEMDNYDIQRTGETKTVNGYACEKYIVTDKKRGTVTESWVTQDIPLTWTEVVGGMTAMSGVKAGQAPTMSNSPMEGIAILSISTDPKGEKTTMEIKDVRLGEANVNPAPLDVSGVQIQDLSGF